MNFRLRTSKQAQDILLDLKDKTNITPNILSRYAVSLSLLEPEPLTRFNYKTDGLEFNRHVLTGKYDAVFKALITQYEGRELSDEEYYPDYLKAHIERGISLLNSEYNYAGNYEKFILNLINYTPGGNI